MELLIDDEAARLEQLIKDSKEFFLTSSQRKAYRQLEALGRLTGTSTYGNFTVRNRALVIGPSGTGKSALIKLYASKSAQKPLMAFNSSSWTPVGTAPPTPFSLTLARDFVRAHPDGGFFFLDEIDKVSGPEPRSSSWAQAVYGEMLGFVDGDLRLQTMGWTENDVLRLRNRFTIHAGGSWEFLLPKLRAQQKRGQLGFGLDRQAAPDYAKTIFSDDSIPAELLYRFSPDLLILEAPTKEDFHEGIERINRSLHITEPAEDFVVDGMVESRLGVRALERYLTNLLIARPDLQHARTDSSTNHSPSYKPRIIQAPELARLQDKISAWVIEIRRDLLHVKFRSSLEGRLSDFGRLISTAANQGAVLELTEELIALLTPFETGRLDLGAAGEVLPRFTSALSKMIVCGSSRLERTDLLDRMINLFELSDRLQATIQSLAGATIERQ